MARPTKIDKNRVKSLGITLLPDEILAVADAAKARGLSRASYIRQALRDAGVLSGAVAAPVAAVTEQKPAAKPEHQKPAMPIQPKDDVIKISDTMYLVNGRTGFKDNMVNGVVKTEIDFTPEEKHDFRVLQRHLSEPTLFAPAKPKPNNIVILAPGVYRVNDRNTVDVNNRTLNGENKHEFSMEKEERQDLIAALDYHRALTEEVTEPPDEE